MRILLAGDPQTGKTSYIKIIYVPYIDFLEINNIQALNNIDNIDFVFLFYDINTYKNNKSWIDAIKYHFPNLHIILIRSKVDDKFGLVPVKHYTSLIKEYNPFVLTNIDISNKTNYQRYKPINFVNQYQF